MRKTAIDGLYAITPDLPDTGELLDKTAQALAGGVRLVQYRNKSAGRSLRREQAGQLMQLCQAYEVPLIINDHVDLALAVDADGVHVGRDDIAIADARKRLGPDKIIGASCYNDADLAVMAEQQGADYVAFGAFFASQTKLNAVTVSVHAVEQARKKIAIAIVGIGGIQLNNAIRVLQSGCDAIAVCGDLFRNPNITEQAIKFTRLFNNL